MKAKIENLVLMFFLLFVSCVDAAPQKIVNGIYVSQINNLNFSKGSYEIVFWAWWNHSLKEYEPEQSIEIIGAQSVKWENVQSFPLPNGKTHTEAKVTAIISQPWNTSNYPFDRQKLKLVIESSNLEADKLQFEIDSGSMVEPQLTLSEWGIGQLTSQAGLFQYQTNFGYLNEKLTYSRLTYEIPITRNGSRVFINNLTGYVVASLLLLIVSLVNTTHNLRSVLEISPRMAMCGAAIFLAIGNKNSIDSTLPISSYFSNIDLIQLFTFSIIPFVILTSIYIDYNSKHKNVSKANKIGLIAFITHTLFFLTTIGLTLYNIGADA